MVAFVVSSLRRRWSAQFARRACIFLSAPGWAAPASAQTAPAADLGGSVAQLLFGLIVVIALLFACLWLLKRLAMPRGQTLDILRIVASAAVGSRERVVVVEVANAWLVLGVAPGQVSALAQLPRHASGANPESREDGNAAITPAPPAFAAWLGKFAERRRP